MKISGIKNSIRIFEYAFKLLELKSNEGLKKLSEIRKPDNVLYLKDLKNEDDLGVNTLLVCQGIPSLILLSFTIELTLKLLIYQETNREYRVHELKKLFEKLPYKLQLEIIHQVNADLNIDDDRFNVYLKDNNMVFINWRYSYESSTPNTAEIGFLQTFYERIKMKVK